MSIRKINTAADLNTVNVGETVDVNEKLLRYPTNALRGPEPRKKRENLFTLAQVNARGEEQNTFINQKQPITAHVSTETVEENGQTVTIPVLEVEMGTQRTATARDIRADWIAEKLAELVREYMASEGITEEKNVPATIKAELEHKAEQETPYFYLRAEITEAPASKRESLFNQMRENWGRIKQSPVQMGKKFAELLGEGMPIEEISKALNFSKDQIFRFLKINSLPEEIKEKIDSKELSIGFGLAILANSKNSGAKLTDEEIKELVAGALTGDQLSDTERKIKVISDRKKLEKEATSKEFPEFEPPLPKLNRDRAKEKLEQARYMVEMEGKEDFRPVLEAMEYIWGVAKEDIETAKAEYDQKKAEFEAKQAEKKAKQAEKKD